ncbi:MAG: AI-2E family transporter [Gemmataceae bacterium]
MKAAVSRNDDCCTTPNQPTAGAEKASLRGAYTTTGVAVVAGVLLAMLWYAREVFLLAFAGVLLAILLHGLADLVSRRTRLSRGWSLTLVVLALLVLVGGGGALLTPSVVDQTEKLRDELPQAAGRFKEALAQYEWGRLLLDNVPPASGWLPDTGSLSVKVLGVFSATLDVVASILLVLCVGVFLAMEPDTYADGLVQLIPPPGRGRARAVLDELGEQLRWWLVGRGVAILFVGLFTALGLWLLGIPFALPLALLTALLGLIPYFGPIIALVPAALLGFMASPGTAAAVVVLYLILQGVEGYILTPVIQRKAGNVPPALTLVAVLLLGVLLGPLALALAMPLTVVGLVLVKRLYVEGFLGDESACVPSATPSPVAAPRHGASAARTA